MAIAWPKERRLIGKDTPRVDGTEKATGRAKYSFDINLPGLLHARILRSPHAHAKIKSLDTSAAEKMPGVGAVHVIKAAGSEVFYAGDEIVALAADTEEHMHDGIRAIKVDYEVLDHLVKEEDALKATDKRTVSGGKQQKSNVQPGGEETRGKVEEAFAKADAVVEGNYGVATVCHQCLESHGLVAHWDKEDHLKVWCSTQATVSTAQGLADHFKMDANNVQCITHYMGGGFGSKFGPDVQGIVAAELAKKAGKPVKLMLDREEEITAGGNRPSAYGKVKIAGNRDGKITAFEIDCYGTPGYGGGTTVNLSFLPYPYDTAAVIPNIKRKHSVVRLNAGGARAMRAPNHPQSCMLSEPAVDDLAAKLDLDPLQVRLKNLPPNQPEAEKRDPTSWNALRNTIFTQEIDIAVRLSDWKNKWHPPGKGPGNGVLKHGIGMALHTWGGSAAGPNECKVIISRSGSVTAETSTQDLGTGQRTVTCIVTAEILGLEPTDINLKIGESQLGISGGSGGSTTCPSQAPATLRAAIAARDDLFAKVAAKLKIDKADLAIEKGKVVDTKNGKSWAWKEFCAKLGSEVARGQGEWSLAIAIQTDEKTKKPLNPGVSNVQVGGVQVAEVIVDTETGVVRCTNVVAVQDCGMVINKLCCESQVAGGVIMGVNYALFEDRIMDRHTGRQVNPDMEFYKLGGIEDMPKIKVHMHDMPERGVIGIGEPPTISTCAAISNAIFNAIGARVPDAPFTPDKVLAALSKKGGNA